MKKSPQLDAAQQSAQRANDNILRLRQTLRECGARALELHRKLNETTAVAVTGTPAEHAQRAARFAADRAQVVGELDYWRQLHKQTAAELPAALAAARDAEGAIRRTAVAIGDEAFSGLAESFLGKDGERLVTLVAAAQRFRLQDHELKFGRTTLDTVIDVCLLPYFRQIADSDRFWNAVNRAAGELLPESFEGCPALRQSEPQLPDLEVEEQRRRDLIRMQNDSERELASAERELDAAEIVLKQDPNSGRLVADRDFRSQTVARLKQRAASAQAGLKELESTLEAIRLAHETKQALQLAA